MGIRMARQRHWIGLGCLAASLIGAMPGAVHAQLQLPTVPTINPVCVATGLALEIVTPPQPGSFQPTCGQMWSLQQGSAQIALKDGTVLVAGGSSDSAGDPTAAAEIYHPALGTFLKVLDMPVLMYEPRPVLLGNGQVLITDGAYGGGTPTQVYHPLMLQFSKVGPLATKVQNLYYYSLTAFGTSNALVAGGITGGINGTPVAEAEVYNASSQSYSFTGPLNQARYQHGAVALANGKVLVVGGLTAPGLTSPTASAEIYDPATGKFTSAGNMTTPRALPTVVRLGDGRVLIAGGGTFQPPYQDLDSAEIYDPASGRFSPTGSMQGGVYGTEGFLMKNGKVLVVGNGNIYDPATGSFSYAPNKQPFQFALDEVTVLLGTGQFLVAGLLGTNAAYLYQPPP